MVRMVLQQGQVGEHRAARHRAFEQVVTEYRAIGQAPVEHRMHRAHVEQPLAGERAGAEHILVDIGSAAAVGVESALAGEQPVEQRAFAGARKRRHDARLQDAEAGHDAARRGVDPRRIERVRGDRHQIAQGARRQAGIAVERDDVGDARREAGDRRVGQEAAGVAGGQQAQQHLQFAALALPTHPVLFGFAPAAWAVQQHEAGHAARRRRMTCVERVDLPGRIVQQGRVVGHRGVRRIGPVGQQRELGGMLPIGQPVQLEPSGQRSGGAGRNEQGRNHDQHTVRLGNAAGKVQARQRLDARRFGQDAMHQRQHGLRHGPQQQRQRDGRDPHRRLRAGPVRPLQAMHGRREYQRDAACDAEQIERQPPVGRPRPPVGRTPAAVRRVRPQCGGQRGSARADQVVASRHLDAFIDLAVLRRTGAGRVGRGQCLLQDGLRHLALGAAGGTRQLLHHVGDLLPCAFAFPAEAWQPAQHPQRAADRFDQVGPLELSDRAQRGDDVADRQVGGRFGGLGLADQAGPVGAMPFGPARQHRRRVAVLDRQPQPQLRQVAVLQAAALHRAIDLVELGLRQRVGGIPGGMRHLACHLDGGNAFGHAPQVLQQHHAQGGGQRPQLAERELVDFLVGVEKRHEQLGVQHAVGVRHVGPGDAVDARQPGQRLRDQLGQSLVVAARHAGANLLELRLDQVEVVEQPFGRRRHVAPAARGQGDVVECVAQRVEVGVDTRKEGRLRGVALVAMHRLRPRQAAAMLLEAVPAEQLGPDWRFNRFVRPD